MGKTLIEILKQFENNKKKWKGTWNENAVAECFKDCAEEILCNGYFEITWTRRENGKDITETRIIDIGCIELYYHEEEGDIKDPIMYHTNDRGSYSQFCEKEVRKNGFPYYEFGSFNLHTSGVDVTFENEEEKYRASFLIRAYRVLKDKTELNIGKKYDGRSSYIFDDMFPQGVLLGKSEKFKIEWKSCEPKGEIDECIKRRNVLEYKKENGKYIKKTKNPGEVQYEKIEPEQKEDRNWGFKRKGITIVNGKI